MPIRSLGSTFPYLETQSYFQARPLLNHALDNEDFKALADPRLENNYVDSEMFRIIEAAAACVRHSAAKRPRMRQVIFLCPIFIFIFSIICVHD